MTIAEPSKEDGVEAHQLILLTSLQEIMQDPAFTDLRLHLGSEPEGGKEVPANRALVASLSPVFRRMLTDDMLERQEGKVRLECVLEEDWKVITEFYFGGRKLVTGENVADMLCIADLYELAALKEHCQGILLDSLSCHNCLKLLDIASFLDLDDHIWNTISDFVGEHFEFICCSEQFLSLSKHCLCELLDSACLVTTEDTLCTSVLNWLERNKMDGGVAADLFGKLRLKDVSPSCLHHRVVCHEQVRGNKSVKKVVRREIRRKRKLNLDCESRGAPYKRFKNEESIIVLGNDDKAVQVLCADLSMMEWHCLRADFFCKDFAACLCDRRLYLTGGCPDNRATHIFSLDTKTWTQGPNLRVGRQEHGMVTIGQSVYVVMGVARQSLSSIESLSLDDKKWRRAGDMKVATCGAGVAAVGETIIALGGVEFCSRRLVQTFNVRTGVSTSTCMSFGVYEACGRSLGNRAVMIGVRGFLISVTLREDGHPVVVWKQMQDFRMHSCRAFVVDSQLMTLFGGEIDKCGTDVLSFNVQGENLHMDSVIPKSEGLSVQAAFRAVIPRY